MIALICAPILGVISIYVWDKCPAAWIVLVISGVFYLIVHKRDVWVRSAWKPTSFKEKLARNTMPPVSAIKAIQERHALNKEAKTENPEPWRLREIAKRLIFIDGYLAGKQQRRISK